MKTADTEGINPAYDEQSGYDTTEDRYPPDWDARKEAVKGRDSYTCQDCGIEAGGAKQSHVHHIKHLSNGGPNYLSNLELLCVDCHNDRHAHDITEGLDDYHPTPSIDDLLHQAWRSLLGGILVLPLHCAVFAFSLTQSGDSSLVGVAYFIAIVVGAVLRPGLTTAVYVCAGGVGLALL